MNRASMNRPSTSDAMTPSEVANLLRHGRDFVWGVATAAYQIEGAAAVDGRGPSTWDTFATKPGATFEGHTGERACDHYHRLEEDLDLLAELGIDAYRFSISWPRVLPEGVGSANERGLAFYDRLVDGLLTRGITPYATLFHWDTPQALEVRGGFRNRAVVGWFTEYTELVARRLGDRVRHWFTLNEPHAFIEGGLRHGRHAPGLTLPIDEVLRAAHHALLCHGAAVQVLRAHVPDSWVAMAPVLVAAVPATDDPADIEAARQVTFGAHGNTLRVTSLWTDPALGRGYPEDILRAVGGRLPAFPSSELDRIARPLDAFGCNLYDCPIVRAGDDGNPAVCALPPGFPRTDFGWPVTPSGHLYGPRFAFERYGLPILITENGLSTRADVSVDGRVHDASRIDFVERHVLALLECARSGVPILGYFHWSLLDNFEWNHGYRERFGLVHVDFQTCVRTRKDSFFAYRELIQRAKSGA